MGGILLFPGILIFQEQGVFPRSWTTVHFLAFDGPFQNCHGQGVIFCITKKI